MNALQPTWGKLTFESEGAEGGPYHSRILHIPSDVSGLTIGRGYDMKLKNSEKIKKDLVAAGANLKDAEILSRAAGLSGQSAKAFITTHKLEEFEITEEAQVSLFEMTYKEEEAEAKRLCTKADVQAKYGSCNWAQLSSAIKQILVDLKFRGDYTGGTRRFLQKHVVANDAKGFLFELNKRSNWASLRVPSDRFKRRVSFFRADRKSVG